MFILLIHVIFLSIWIEEN